MIGTITISALFAEQMCKTARIHQVDIQDVILTHYPLFPYVFSFTFRSHIAREMLTYCHAPVHSCSWLIPCEERALTIRGFSAGQRTHGDVKFFTNGKTVHCPQMTQILQIYTEDALHLSQSRWGGGGNSGAKHILRFISLQVTISHYKSP